MRGKALTTRRQKNRALAQLDASRRCDYCKRPLAEAGQTVEDFVLPGKYCSTVCLESKRDLVNA